MQISLPSDVQDHLLRLSIETGQSPEHIVESMIAERLSYDEWFRASVAEGFASLDRGEFFTQEEVEARLQHHLRA